MKIEDQGYLHRSNPVKAPSIKRDKRRYCHFHRNHGHNIEEYRQLKDEIEVLIRQGHLGKYISDRINQTTEQ